MNGSEQNKIRYGVEIKPPSLHGECKGLAQVMALVGNNMGIVRVFDRTNQRLIFDGTVKELRERLRFTAGDRGQSALEPLEHSAKACL